METGQKITRTNNNIDITKNNILSIQVSLSGLSFCILNSLDNTFIFYKSFQFERKLNPEEVLDKLVHQFNTEESLNQSFKSVTVIHDNEISALVPKPLFNEDYLADYLKFNSKILRSDFITYDEIQIANSVNVYVPYININNHIYDRFGEFEYKHFSTVVLNTILGLEKNATDKKMYVHVCPTHFEIIVTNNGQLLFYNTFEYNAKEDFIYYILFTAEQLQISPEEFPLILLGNTTEEDELYSIAYKYVRNVSISKLSSYYKLDKDVTNNCLNNFVLANSF